MLASKTIGDTCAGLLVVNKASSTQRPCNEAMLIVICAFSYYVNDLFRFLRTLNLRAACSRCVLNLLNSSISCWLWSLKSSLRASNLTRRIRANACGKAVVNI